MPIERLQRTRAAYPDWNPIAAIAAMTRRYDREFQRQSARDAVIDLVTAPIVWEPHTHVFELNTTHGGYWCACGEQWLTPAPRCYCVDGLPAGVTVAPCPIHPMRTVRRGPSGQTS